MTDDMPRCLPPHVYREVTRHGRTVWYFRRRKGKRIRLPDFGGAEFDAAYVAALGAASVSPRRRTAPGTLMWLVERYRECSAYRSLSIATRRQRDNIFKGIVAKAGHLPLKFVDTRKIKAGLEDRANTPAQARHFVDTMRGMFEWAVDAGLADTDPTAGVKPPKRDDGDGFEPWTDDDVAAYEGRWPIGTKERVWLAVLLYTGFRRGDAVRFGRQHVREGIATIRTEKTGTEVTFRLHDALIAALSVGPTGDLAYIVGEKGAPLKKESFGNLFRAACTAAGVGKSAHGLRKLSATRFAEAGASEAELDARFGWTGRKMASLYTRKAERRRLALQADDRMANKSPAPSSSGVPHPKKTTAIANG